MRQERQPDYCGQFQCSPAPFRRHAKKLKLAKGEAKMTQPAHVKRPWTESEVRKLKQLAMARTDLKQLVKLLDRSPASIKLKAHWLNLSLDTRSK
jgi:hypothetical protein